MSARTLPVSGMTWRGVLFELPTSEPPTAAPGCSPSLLLKTPTAQLAVNGGSQHPDKRKAGGHGPTLADEAEHLLPTPKASDHKGQNQRRDTTCVPGAVASIGATTVPPSRDGNPFLDG